MFSWSVVFWFLVISKTLHSSFLLYAKIARTIVGKENLEDEIIKIIKKYPEVIKTFPVLLAIRDKSIEILIDTKNFIYRNYNFKQRKLADDEIKDLSDYILKSGFGAILKDRKIKNLVDYVNGKMYFVEVNFYGGGGSKLKSTATEYVKMNEFWNNQGVEFIWITDGAGWKSTLKPLREYFDKADYLLNLELLKGGVLKQILNV